MDAAALARAMAVEFVASVPLDERGWLEAAERILAAVEREASVVSPSG